MWLPGFVQESLEALGMESYSMRHGVDKSVKTGGVDVGHCTTVHGILRSRRGDGKEALVLVTPMAMGAVSV